MKKGNLRPNLTPEQIARIPVLVQQYKANGYTNWADLIGLRMGVTGAAIREQYKAWQARNPSN